MSPFISARLETRMTADINVIQQLLQRQMAPVPPAYSTVFPSPHSPHPNTLYNTGGPPTIQTVAPIQAMQINTTVSLLQSPESEIRHLTEASDDTISMTL
ncbi:hypothetical protein Q8A73_015995 [Channa argus]|nr:hypothetical protein Q8A73_015995 [Channa argus]